METTGPKPTDLAYAAGFMDGEGCFDLAGGSPRVTAINTCPHPLEFLRGIFGGTVRCKAPPGERHRGQFSWTAYGEKALAACRALLPHLREKARQAELLIEFRGYPPNSAMRDLIDSQLRSLKRVEYT